jgi:hypothetical protein
VDDSFEIRCTAAELAAAPCAGTEHVLGYSRPEIAYLQDVVEGLALTAAKSNTIGDAVCIPCSDFQFATLSTIGDSLRFLHDSLSGLRLEQSIERQLNSDEKAIMATQIGEDTEEISEMTEEIEALKCLSSALSLVIVGGQQLIDLRDRAAESVDRAHRAESRAPELKLHINNLLGDALKSILDESKRIDGVLKPVWEVIQEITDTDSPEEAISEIKTWGDEYMDAEDTIDEVEAEVADEDDDRGLLISVFTKKD